MTRALDLVGQKFCRLTVLERVENDKHGKSMWLCVCDCGNQTIVNGSALKKGNTKACGCLNEEMTRTRALKHGHSQNGKVSSEYTAWYCMIQRCDNPKNKDYAHYGGRGITVCERWGNSFENFYRDMGDKPSPRHSIDRIDNSKGYSPDNCIWATKAQQARNRRKSSLNVTGVKGVYRDKKHEKFYSCITTNKKTTYLGSFHKLEDAIKAREQAELKYWTKSS